MARKTKKRKVMKPSKPTPDMRRRAALKLLWSGGVSLAVLGAAGIWTVRSVQAMAAERDLSQVGQGKPVVVQVHDPQCPTCTALQRQTRKALRQFGECDMLYLVADITQPEGGAFARRYGVPHVTLLLFDADGTLQTTIFGMQSRSDLEPIFAGHFKAFGTGI